MKKIRRRDGSEVMVDDDYILASGESYTIPMSMMDSARRMVTDASGNPAGCRPGFLYNDSDSDIDVVRTTIYAQYDHDISQRWQSDRWQTPKSAPAKPRDAGTGDVDAAHAEYRRDIENRWRK